ncbi:hypothetical protein SAMN04488498_12523 [Mesorhizobium albiziae]|uniref:Tetratricopeptide repeat-containing protein n=1 Tax=Neomesorhizobium albiziae TaxID=335020 RepID=A0A1I4EH40_9HYPH|nr:hypothetical protein SAMN04488498_12523 [Mesorhizobium albiziae]
MDSWPSLLVLSMLSNVLGTSRPDACTPKDAALERIDDPQFWTEAYLGACHAMCGRNDRAAHHVARLYEMRPDFRLGVLKGSCLTETRKLSNDFSTLSERLESKIKRPLMGRNRLVRCDAGKNDSGRSTCKAGIRRCHAAFVGAAGAADFCSRALPGLSALADQANGNGDADDQERDDVQRANCRNSFQERQCEDDGDNPNASGVQALPRGRAQVTREDAERSRRK